MKSYLKKINELENSLVETIDRAIKASGDAQQAAALKHKRLVLTGPEYQGQPSLRRDFLDSMDRYFENDQQIHDSQQYNQILRERTNAQQSRKAVPCGSQRGQLCCYDQ